VLLIILFLISVLLIVISSTRFHLHPFLALLFAALFFGLFSMPLQQIVVSINEGFGGTIGHIGIIIIFGTIIGAFLEHSGGAFAIAEKLLKLIGKNRVPMAMTMVGYIVSIPVFADSGFVILSPLNKALSKRAKRSLAGTAIALSLGLMVSHTLIPPTPGPIAATGILKADLGMVILLGLPTSLIAMLVGWLFAEKFASKIYIDPNPELSEEDTKEKLQSAPSAFNALLPILIPILFIIIKSISTFPSAPLGDGFIQSLFEFLGEPLIALMLGVLLAMRLPKKISTRLLSSTGWVGKALLNAAIIIMITGAGGAFGKVLQNSGIASVIGEKLSDASLGIWLPFIIAAAIKTAQGSSTVALITTASIIAPMTDSLGFDTSVVKALVVLAIGAGSMVTSHVNDSFFWVVTQMSRMDMRTGYKLQSLGSFIIGLASAIVIWIIHLVVQI
jgi:GntP family gluconate:H+ symporter